MSESELRKKSDSDCVVEEVKNPHEHIILTGDRPTGPLHLGHYIGSLKARVHFQELLKQYILIADVQALTDNAENPDKVRNNVLQVMLDYLAVGINPEKTTIYIASAIPETAELTLYYLNLVNLGRLQRNPTIKTEIKDRGFEESIPVGFLTYPVNQAADISQFKATLVPVGEDQIPMIEQTNEIVRKVNRVYKTECLVECKAFISGKGLLPGTDGSSKMSKSLGNAIMLSDSEKEISKKVKGMFTDPNHLRIEDPGTVAGNPVFTYLDVFGKDQIKIQELKDHYQRGGLGDGTVKQYLNEVLQEFLAPIRQRREEFAKDPAEVMKLLQKGTEAAREVAANTLAEVKRAMGILYF